MLEELKTHGIQPTPSTPPSLVQEFVSDLYRYELRRLRNKQVRGEIQKVAYSDYVVALRRKYILISVPIRLWTT